MTGEQNIASWKFITAVTIVIAMMAFVQVAGRPAAASRHDSETFDNEQRAVKGMECVYYLAVLSLASWL